VAQGVGPLAFSALFSYFTQRAHYYPAAPLIGATVVMCFGFLIALSLDIPADRLGVPPLADGITTAYGSHALHGSTDTERLLLESELAALVPSKQGSHPLSSSQRHHGLSRSQQSPVKSYSLKVQTRSSFSSQ